ncbi:MAG: ATP-grasp fold amidoligase family protein [Pseudolysinimonas sp.]
MALWIPPPSFSRSIARASRDRPFPVVEALFGKVAARELLTALDLPIPGDFEALGSIADLRPVHIDRPRVLKPESGSNNRGFVALEPLGSGRWRDVVHDDILTFDDVREYLARALVTHRLTDRWVAEELLRSPRGGIADDVKVLTFRGEIGATFIRTNSPKLFRWFDADWAPLESGLVRHTIGHQILPPPNSADFDRLAVEISRALPVPFVRVDFLASDRGPVVGELTPFPGWAHDLSPDLDERLGLLYERAETVLVRAGMDWGSLVDDERLRPFLPTRAVSG